MKFYIDNINDIPEILSQMPERYSADECSAEDCSAEKTEIILKSGIYYLTEPLIITNKKNLIIRGEPGTVISGGIRIHPVFSHWKDNIFKAEISEADDSFQNLENDQLYINGIKQIRARYPNYNPSVRYWNGYSEDSVSDEKIKSWKNPTGGIIHTMHEHHWGDMHFMIDGAENGNLILSGGHQNNRPSKMHRDYRYVENIFEELDDINEWYFDRESRILYYIPPKDFDFSDAVFEVSNLKNLITLENCKNIEISNLVLRHTSYTFMEKMEPLLRSDWMIYRGGAIFCEHGENITLKNLTLDETGGNGIFISGKNHHVTVTGCHIKNTGASGVCFVGKSECIRNPLFNYNETIDNFDDIDMTKGSLNDEYPFECTVRDCLIEASGRIEKQTSGVQISMSSRISVIHNSIYNVPRAGINISEGTFGGHLIEANDVFNTVLETGDHGAFNSWGRDRFWYPDTEKTELLVREHPDVCFIDCIETTYIRGNRMQCSFGWDIDLDDGSSNYDICNNLCLSGGLKNREGWRRHNYNNIICENTFHPHVWYHGSMDKFERNIIFSPYADIRLSEWGESFDCNFIHTPESVTEHADELSEKSGMDKNSLKGDAEFVKYYNGDTLPSDNSPVFLTGFDLKPFINACYGVESEHLKKIALTPYTAKILVK